MMFFMAKASIFVRKDSCMKGVGVKVFEKVMVLSIMKMVCLFVSIEWNM